MAKDFRAKIGGSKGKDKNSVISGLIRGSGPKNEKYTLVLLPHQKVYSKAQARKKFKNIDGLAATMKGGKQEQPITVFEADADGRHPIKVGERRWRACVLNDEPVWAQIAHGVPKPETMDAKTLVDQIIENDQREPLSPMEMAENLAELRDVFGMKTGQIAEEMGRKPAFVSKHLKLLEMPEPVQQLLEDEIVTYIETLNTLTSIFNLSERAGLELVELARTKGELTRDEAQTRLKTLKGSKSPQPVHGVNQQDNNGNVDGNNDQGETFPSRDNDGHNSFQANGNDALLVGKDTTGDEDDNRDQGETFSPRDNDDHSSSQPNGNDAPPVVTNTPTAVNDAPRVETSNSMQDKATDSQSLNTAADHAETSAKGSVTFYVQIDDSVFELVDKPSITENGEVYVFCREKEGMPEMQVPITDCMLHHASLTK
ncbi:ParB/RepB/Spo0J family partition protein [Salmonella enterica subsp. enterica serovar Hvittingfoss]|uniref:ParB/RepB/Spo0J family partition protein n=1 Tax=Salmonella enterica TaxID=28901 RepID=UPI001117F219|nr:ParB/RepB/Spo0J family partition protein [Salmonella enterica]EBS1713067.1 ParB/RepB/Spo0J family partition protein [Salmonella enterica subsp. enterica serovar Vitkin]ECD9254106.1 ParB/RepB/Spo0J family partition protein [Salmonella enterica subsp. diarizonae]ECY4195981.1 ParB/RepB/Spo0J family partition protein [Salmonella enterica subsp. enterica serovar Ball]EDQ3155797.1 ParB/RepB/Spo0J family partition protein [Salmonella enterica subsp. enterica serovar Abony]EDT5393468.1 ParB/RepB/Sp